ncbi:MAG: 50S ribosomal protein L17 [Actinomycetes bacterium]|mgnify:FL=1|jgi:large subunit ribosomal protein L17|nr:50S ribosomal protein L17 [Acidimicrobiia bacterium]
MPRPKKGPRFGGSPAHSRHLMINLATALIRDGRVETTLARAKAVRPLAEKLISRARVDGPHNRRIVRKTITDRETLTKLFTEVGPNYADRAGGYTRIVKVGPRRGDGSEMAIIELV